MKPLDPTQRKFYPGDAGNPFDVFLHALEKIERIPTIIFSLILATLSVIINYPNLLRGLPFLIFITGDWIALALLPVLRKSYGPAKPPTLLLAILRSSFCLIPLSTPAWLGIQFFGTAMVIYGFWLEPHHIRMSIQKMEVEGWHSESPLRLLHLGDLHMERVTSRELELNRMVGELNPDLILFSGDILNLSYLEDPRSIEDARQVISGWHAPLGVYIVAGSPAVDLPESLAAILDGLDVHFLNNQAIQLDFEGNPLTLIGLQSTQRPYIEGPILSGLVKEENPGSFKILLYHTPDLAPEASACGINLQLSGHTHGGQVRLPLIGALMTGSLYGKKFEAGRYKVGKTVLYVTRGIGMEGGGAPRVRFLCPPEVILWEISGKTG